VPRKRSSPAVRFLWIIAGLTLLFVAGAVAYRLFETDLMRWAMVPKGEFEPVPMPAGSSYADKRLWIARPDIARNPSLWVPERQDDPEPPQAIVFFVHPTTFLESSAWNATITDRESQERAALFVRSQASAFNGVGEVWAPRYRQAAFGAFLTDAASARRALDFAYRDVLAAYEHFIAEAPRDRPIILAGHSQGSLHVLRLLAERVKDAPEERRVAAAYVVGWPVSETADLPFLPLPACERPDQARCLLSWQSFAEPADPKLVTDAYDASVSAAGARRAGSPMLCVNPLTGTRGGISARESNLGTLIPDANLRGARMQPHRVPARCDVRGFLLIGDNDRLPGMGPYVLPGNNYHVYDYALFWANIRADADRRITAFRAGRR
jgi:hypothetical protein